MKSLEINHGINTILAHAALGVGALLMIFPSIWMVFASFRSTGGSVQIPPTILPKRWMKENYLRAIASLLIMKLYVNTALLIPFRMLCAVAFPSVAGSAFAKLKFRRKNLLFSLVIIQMMLPSQIFTIPQYQMLAGMGLANSMFALVFLGLVNAFGTFLLRQVYMGIPDELGEAAYLSGCTGWQTFTKVMMPLTRASMATLTIFITMFACADLVWSLVADTDLNMMTLSAGFSTLRGQSITNRPVLMTGSVLATIPMVIPYLVFQKQSIEGIAMANGKWKTEMRTEMETDRDRYI